MKAGASGARVGCVFFDLYGTLVELAGLETACEAVAGNRGAELAARWRARQVEATWLRTAMGRWTDFGEVTRDALIVAGEELGIALDRADVEQQLLPAWIRLPARVGLDELLDRLEASGVPTGILTNGSVAMLEATVAGADLGGRFRWSLSVDAVRRYKPAPEVYDLVVQASAVEPRAIGFVTANGWDAAGAAAFGFRVAWLRAPGGFLPALGRLEAPPVAVTIDGVAELFGA